MRQLLAHVTLLVRDYDEAIAWFTDKLGFKLIADQYQAEQRKRWVLIAPPGSPSDAASILLARASSHAQEQFIGDQAGGRVFLFLQTDNFARDFQKMTERGVCFTRPPSEQAYGTVAVFKDLYGNLWDLIEFTSRTRPQLTPTFDNSTGCSDPLPGRRADPRASSGTGQ